jgi:hypothetical protein
VTTAPVESSVPVLLLGESRRRRLHERLTATVERWYRLWAPARSGDVFVELAGDAQSLESTVRAEAWAFAGDGEVGDPWLYLSAPTDFLRILSGVGPSEGVFTTSFESPSGSLAAALTEDILGVLCRELQQAAGTSKVRTIHRVEAGAIDPSASRRSAQRQMVVISIATDRVRALLELSLSPGFVDACLGQRPRITSREALVGRRQAIGDEATISVRAVLGQTLVSWADLNALSIGDVIVLDQPLSAACSLQVGDTGSIADAQLGRVDSVLAAQITNIRTRKAG